MDEATRKLVRLHAGDRCEYCLHRQEDAETTHHIKHVVAKQHLGSDDLSNLALACIHCNSHKGPNLTGIAFLQGARREVGGTRVSPIRRRKQPCAGSLGVSTPEVRRVSP